MRFAFYIFLSDYCHSWLLEISAKRDPLSCHWAETEDLLWGAFFGSEMSGGCIDDDAIQADSMLAGNGGKLDNWITG
jgi:hypothetical protein